MFASLRDLMRPVVAPILGVALVAGLAVGAFAYAQDSEGGIRAREVATQQAAAERSAEQTAKQVAKAIAAADRADRAAAAEEAAQRRTQERIIARKAARQEAAAAKAEAEEAAAAAAEEAARRAAVAAKRAERRATVAAARAERQRRTLTGEITVPDVEGALVTRVGGFPGQRFTDFGGGKLVRLWKLLDALEGGKTFPCPLGAGGEYGDIVPGGRVVVEDGEGKVLASTSLTGGRLSATGCTFSYETEVPRSASYEVAITHRGAMTISYEKLEAADWHVAARL